MVEVRPGPESRNERVACFGVLEINCRRIADRLLAPRAGHDHFTMLIVTGRQISPDQDLLRARRYWREYVRIYGGHLYAAKLHLQIAQARLCDFVQQFLGNSLRFLVAGYAANRAVAESGDSFKHRSV